MSDLDKIITCYAAFEIRVRKHITAICFPYCRDCRDICCKPEFCREAAESPFLLMVREKFPASAAYSEKQGWLTRKGCALCAGRPPVCYEFFCSKIMSAQPTSRDRKNLELLGLLISGMGKNALGSRHLVEIMLNEKLQRVRFSRFEKRLGKAEEIMGELSSKGKQK